MLLEFQAVPGAGAAMSKVTRARKSCTVLTDKTNEPSTPSTMEKVGNRNSLEALNPGSKHCLEASSAVIPAKVKQTSLAHPVELSSILKHVHYPTATSGRLSKLFVLLVCLV